MAGEILTDFRDGLIHLLGLTRTNKTIYLSVFHNDTSKFDNRYYQANSYSELVKDYIELLTVIRKNDENISRRMEITLSPSDSLEDEGSFDIYVSDEEIEMEQEELDKVVRTLLEGTILCLPKRNHYLREAYEQRGGDFQTLANRKVRIVRRRKSRGNVKRAS